MSDTAAPAPGAQVGPAGRKLLRLEVRNSQVPIERKPEWIKTRLRTGPEYTALKSLVRREGLHTVCEEAGCPNIYECWEDREATFLIGGDQCTRRCDFCQIDTGKPAELDRDEPRRVAESVAAMGLRYATVAGVARDIGFLGVMSGPLVRSSYRAGKLYAAAAAARTGHAAE